MIPRIKKTVKENMILRKSVYPILSKILMMVHYRRRLIKKYGFEVLKLVDETAQEHNIPYYVDFGTLLGIIREGGFIKHDNDMDFTILPSNSSLLPFIKGLLSKNFVIEFAYLMDDKRFYEFRVRYKETPIDFYLPQENENFLIFRGPQDIVKYPKPSIDRLPVKHFSINIPSNINNHLEWCYGDNWKVPDKHWNSNKAKKSFMGNSTYASEEINNIDQFLNTIDHFNRVK
jgi:hypothetical protein